MNKLGTLFGLLILIAGSFGVYRLFQNESAADEAAEPETATHVAVQVAKIQKTTLRAFVHGYGTVELDPGSSQTEPASMRITAPTSGIITDVKCIDGQQVNKGDVLFRLDSKMADVSIEKATQALEFAEKNLERQTRLQKIEGTSDKLYLEAQHAVEAAQAELASAQAQRTLLAVSAPFSGTIVRLSARTGQTVDMAQELADLRDLKRVVVMATVPSREVARINLGQPVIIDTGMLATDSTTATISVLGTLTYIDPQVNAQNDTVTIRAALAPGAELRPGQFVTIRISYEEHAGCLAMPEEGVVMTPEGETVIAVVKGDTAERRAITPGLREGGLVEIIGEGITDGTPVVTVGAYGLPEQSKIRVVGQ